MNLLTSKKFWFYFQYPIRIMLSFNSHFVCAGNLIIMCISSWILVLSLHYYFFFSFISFALCPFPIHVGRWELPEFFFIYIFHAFAYQPHNAPLGILMLLTISLSTWNTQCCRKFLNGPKFINVSIKTLFGGVRLGFKAVISGVIVIKLNKKML